MSFPNLTCYVQSAVPWIRKEEEDEVGDLCVHKARGHVGDLKIVDIDVNQFPNQLSRNIYSFFIICLMLHISKIYIFPKQRKIKEFT